MNRSDPAAITAHRRGPLVLAVLLALSAQACSTAAEPGPITRTSVTTTVSPLSSRPSAQTSTSEPGPPSTSQSALTVPTTPPTASPLSTGTTSNAVVPPSGLTITTAQVTDTRATITSTRTTSSSVRVSPPTAGHSTLPTSRSSTLRTSPPPTWTSTPAPAPGFPAGLAGLDIERIPTNRPVVTLTFDAGANADGLPSILASLRATGVSATFFLTGHWATTFPAGVRQIAAAHYRIGNHSDTHPMMTSLRREAISAELTTARAKILAAGGTDPLPLFRFPFGDRDARTIEAVNRVGYVAVRWTVDTLGWQGTNGGMTRQAVIDRVLAAARPGCIVLMHLGSNPDDGTTLDADALPTIISGLRARGYRFVTLAALL
jgi:peptidoglycan/xylan/chitin deacetylase (PgdA/CDA1 family)